MRRNLLLRPLPAALALAFVFGCSGCDKSRKGALSPASPEEVAAAASTPGGKVHSISAADFNAHAQVPDRLVVVDFYADWCGPCRELSPILQLLASEFPSNVLFLKVNIDENKALAKKLGVSGIPDVRFFRDGKEVDSMVGLGSSQEIRKMISTHAPLEKLVSDMVDAKVAPSASPPRSGIFGLLDKTRAGMEKRAEQATIPPDAPAAPKGNNANSPSPQAAPAPPAIRPIKPNEKWLPPGMGKGSPP